MLIAHQAAPGPADLWAAWAFDPVAAAGLAVVVVLYARGRRDHTDRPPRQAAFAGGILAVAVAVLTPLEAAAAALASAHMVQHVLLVLVAAPLIAWSAPGAALVRGLPASVRRWQPGVRRTLGIDAGALRALRSPVGRWLAYVAVLWIWHSALLYSVAVEHEAAHALEHLLFLAAAWGIWAVIVGPARHRVPNGAGLLLVFGLALQTVFLSALLTFTTEPWYDSYADTAARWGLSPLADQQLAGVIMWVPAGLIHVCVAIGLLASWLHETEASDKRDGVGGVLAET